MPVCVFMAVQFLHCTVNVCVCGQPVRLYWFSTKNKTPWCFALRQRILGQAGLRPTRVLTLMKQPSVYEHQWLWMCVSERVRVVVFLFFLNVSIYLFVHLKIKNLTFPFLCFFTPISDCLCISTSSFLFLIPISPSFYFFPLLNHCLIPCPFLDFPLSKGERTLHSSEQI